jgi:chromosome segregation ATPase
MTTRELRREATKTTVPIAKRRGKGPADLHVSTKKLRKVVNPPTLPARLNPPQAELLASEYVHNLQQQLYFLEAELRFLHDRSGVDEQPGDTSVDSAIRRLRRARAMQEEETDAKITEFRKQIEDLKIEMAAIDRSRAQEALDEANSHEHERIEILRSAFVEMAAPIHLHQLSATHFDVAAEFHESMKQSMLQQIAERKSRRNAQEDEMRKIRAQLDEIRSNRKGLLTRFNDSIRKKRLYEEEADVLRVLGAEEEQAMANMPISGIRTQNAKIEKDIEAARAMKAEIEVQLDQLLEKNVKLKADLNDISAKVERGKRLRDKMESQFSARLAKTKTENAKLKAELTDLIEQKRTVKANFTDNIRKYEEFLAQMAQCQGEIDLLLEAIGFKDQERRKLEAQNEVTKGEIDALVNGLAQMRQDLAEISKETADAMERLTIVQTRVELNHADPRCKMENVPPELQQLLDSLNAVNEKLE